MEVIRVIAKSMRDGASVYVPICTALVSVILCLLSPAVIIENIATSSVSPVSLALLFTKLHADVVLMQHIGDAVCYSAVLAFWGWLVYRVTLPTYAVPASIAAVL